MESLGMNLKYVGNHVFGMKKKSWSQSNKIFLVWLLDHNKITSIISIEGMLICQGVYD